MTEFKHLDEKLRLAKQEIGVMRKRARKYSVEKADFKRMKALWEGKTGSISETLSSAEQFFTWTVPTIEEAKFFRVINTHLRANNRRLKVQVKDLEQHLKLTQDELKNKGVKMTIIKKSKAKLSENEDRTTRRLKYLCFQFIWLFYLMKSVLFLVLAHL